MISWPATAVDNVLSCQWVSQSVTGSTAVVGIPVTCYKAAVWYTVSGFIAVMCKTVYCSVLACPALAVVSCDCIHSKSVGNPQLVCNCSLVWCIGKSTSGKKYQVEYGTFSLGKRTILVLFPIGTFSYIIGKSTIIFH